MVSIKAPCGYLGVQRRQILTDHPTQRVLPQNISAWKLNEGIARQMADDIASIGKYEVMILTCDRARLVKELNKLSVNDAPYLVTRQWKD